MHYMVLAGQSDQPHHQRPRRWRGSECPVESQLGRLLFNLSLTSIRTLILPFASHSPPGAAEIFNYANSFANEKIKSQIFTLR